MDHADIETLSAPLFMGRVRLRNRLTIAPHSVNLGISDDGVVDRDYLAYIATRARGFALTTVGLGTVDPLGRAEQGTPLLWDDRCVPELRKIAVALRDVGSEPCLQLSHAGGQASHALIASTPVAPSPKRPLRTSGPLPRALTTGEVERVVQSFVAAAGRAVEAGFRVLNLHFAHGYLASQFMSPATNFRRDRYGGSLENRMRFGLEVVAGIRAQVGDDVAIDVRINGRDFVSGGTEVPDAMAFARALASAGADAINVSGGMYGSDPFSLLLPFDGLEFLPLAAAVKGTVQLPVTAVGNFRFPADAAQAVRAGSCDLVGVVRAAMADPDWALKALGSLPGAVRPCLGTLDGCSERVHAGESASCQVNPDLGREARTAPVPGRSRHVLVVGAGPAGAQAALTAALAGHRVTLVDRADRVGGMLTVIAGSPGGQWFGDLAEFFRSELSRLEVDVRLATPFSSELLEAVSPDQVVVATGARQDPPAVEGIEHGTTWPDEEVMDDPSFAPARVVVLSAGRRAAVVALALADRGCRVTLIDTDGVGVAKDASGLMRRAYRQQLAGRGVRVTSGRVGSILEAAVRLQSGEDVPADAVVVSGMPRPDRHVIDVVRAFGLGAVVVGDAKQARTVAAAIAEGQDAAEGLSRPP